MAGPPLHILDTEIPMTENQRFFAGIMYSLVLSIFGGVVVYMNIERFCEKFIKAGLFGIDLNKSTTGRDDKGQLVRPINGIKIPEAMGVISGAAYIVCTCLFLPFTTMDPQSNDFLELIAGIMCIMCMNFLGFADNVLDLKWRDKIVLPFFATLPIMLVYYMNNGSTTMVLPFGVGAIYLGPLFYVFLCCIVIFCTNAINIYAGVNGLEVGQSVVIGISIVILNIIQLFRLPEGWPLREQHVMSMYIMLPFLGVSMPLLYYNWWPSKVFVGDTYCYFAGMSFAVAAILGHFTKTLLLLNIPQLFNFLYSIPQLFKIVPCPRHRMPGFDPKTGLLVNSYGNYPHDYEKEKIPTGLKATLGKGLLKFLGATGLCDVKNMPDGSIKFSNLTLINLVIMYTGPIREDKLTTKLMILQVICALFCYSIRFGISQLFYDVVW